MELQLPKWLDEAFLAKLLQTDKKEDISISKFSAEPAVAIGENYTSQLYRVYVQYKANNSVKEEASTFIMKFSLDSGFYASPEKDLFGREFKIYMELLPKMSKKIKLEFGPKLFVSPVEKVLILHDLKEEGFIMSDKLKQLDFSHCKQVFITIAKFHASSIACYHNDPNFIKTITNEYVYADSAPAAKEAKSWVELAFSVVKEIVSDMEGMEQSANLLSSKADQIWDTITDIFKPKEGRLNVLNHGDLWNNNILFKHNHSGEVTDVKFVDFQIMRYASPMTDLINFIWTSANEEVREHQQRNLYDIYRQTLNTTLEQLGCEERLTEAEMQQDLKSACDWALVVICQTRPVIMAEPENAFSIDDLNSDEVKTGKSGERFKQFFNGKRYKSLLPNLLRQCQDWTSSL